MFLTNNTRTIQNLIIYCKSTHIHRIIRLSNNKYLVSLFRMQVWVKTYMTNPTNPNENLKWYARYPVGNIKKLVCLTRVNGKHTLVPF